MSIDKVVMAFVGAVVLVSLGLGVFVNQNWFWLTAFAGANIFQASFTGFCPLASILKKFGVKQGAAF
jgi:hypothetical protein